MLNLSINNPQLESFYNNNQELIEKALNEYAIRTTMPQSAREILDDIEALEHGELETMPFDGKFWDKVHDKINQDLRIISVRNI